MYAFPSRARHDEVPWTEAEFCAVDIETTGLDPRADSIISFGAVRIREGRIVTSTQTYLLVNPQRAVPADSAKVHSLRTADLMTAPSLDRCRAIMEDSLDGAILVAHSAWIEREFLRRALHRSRRRLGGFIDTAQLAQAYVDFDLPPGVSVSLEYAAHAFGLPGFTPHHALGDAMTTAQLFIWLAKKLSADRAVTVADLRSVSGS